MVNLLQDLDLSMKEHLDSGVDVDDKSIQLDFISLLPSELAIQTIKYVNSIQMMKVLPLVSCRWRKISQDNDIWRSLFVQRWGRPRNQIKAFVEKDWKALYRSRLDLNENWNKGYVNTFILN